MWLFLFFEVLNDSSTHTNICQPGNLLKAKDISLLFKEMESALNTEKTVLSSAQAVQEVV